MRWRESGWRGREVASISGGKDKGRRCLGQQEELLEKFRGCGAKATQIFLDCAKVKDVTHNFRVTLDLGSFGVAK